MPQHQPERESKIVSGKPFIPYIPYMLDIPGIVAKHIAGIMVDPALMGAMNTDLDAYVQSLTPEERLAQRETIRKQLTTGSKVCESILNRYLSS